MEIETLETYLSHS